MQIAVGIDRHRCLVAQRKNRSGCLARMEITDVAALRRFHIEPLDNTDYPIFISVTPCNFRFTETIIDGGCHAGFGSYGTQKGDGAPVISAEEQQQTADALAAWINLKS